MCGFLIGGLERPALTTHVHSAMNETIEQGDRSYIYKDVLEWGIAYLMTAMMLSLQASSATCYELIRDMMMIVRRNGP